MSIATFAGAPRPPTGASDQAHAIKAGSQPEAAMTGLGDNDTSVIRGPVTMKTGRLDSYVRDLASRRLMIPTGLIYSPALVGVWNLRFHWTNREIRKDNKRKSAVKMICRLPLT